MKKARMEYLNRWIFFDPSSWHSEIWSSFTSAIKLYILMKFALPSRDSTYYYACWSLQFYCSTNSHEARIHQAMRKNVLERKPFTPPRSALILFTFICIFKRAFVCVAFANLCICEFMLPLFFVRFVLNCYLLYSVSRSTKPIGFLGKTSASSSKLNKPSIRP